MIVKSLKITLSDEVVEIKDFLYAHIRKSWLLDQGFFETAGIWQHLDGRIAGLFDKRIDGEGGGTPVSQSIYDNCANPLKRTQSNWRSLLGGVSGP